MKLNRQFFLLIIIILKFSYQENCPNYEDFSNTLRNSNNKKIDWNTLIQKKTQISYNVFDLNYENYFLKKYENLMPENLQKNIKNFKEISKLKIKTEGFCYTKFIGCWQQQDGQVFIVFQNGGVSLLTLDQNIIQKMFLNISMKSRFKKYENLFKGLYEIYKQTKIMPYPYYAPQNMLSLKKSGKGYVVDKFCIDYTQDLIKIGTSDIHYITQKRKFIQDLQKENLLQKGPHKQYLKISFLENIIYSKAIQKLDNSQAPEFFEPNVNQKAFLFNQFYQIIQFELQKIGENMSNKSYLIGKNFKEINLRILRTKIKRDLWRHNHIQCNRSTRWQRIKKWIKSIYTYDTCRINTMNKLIDSIFQINPKKRPNGLQIQIALKCIQKNLKAEPDREFDISRIRIFQNTFKSKVEQKIQDQLEKIKYMNQQKKKIMLRKTKILKS